MTELYTSLSKTGERICLALSAKLIPNGFLPETYRSPLDTLLVLAIGQANLAHLSRDWEFQKAYARLDRSPPDDLRRPVRVRSIATSLGVPQETARRRVAAMVQAGSLVQTEAGVYVPNSVTQSPVYEETAIETWRSLGEVYVALRREGALPEPGPEAVSEPTDAGLPLRLIMRLWGDHFLRLVEALLPMVGETFDIVLLFTVLRESLVKAPGGPISASALSRGLGLPFETVRRNLLRLVGAGLCEKTRAGYLVTSELLDEPRWRACSERHGQIVLRFFSVVREQRLLGWWEADFLATRAAEPAAFG